MTRRRARLIVLVGLVGAISGACATAPPFNANSPTTVTLGPSATAPPFPAPASSIPIAVGLPAHLYAPYVEMWAGDKLTTLADASGARYFTFAFLESTGKASCDLAGMTSLDDAAARDTAADALVLRTMGGDIIPSFGGYSADHEGREIADSCPDVSKIAAGYESVITMYGVTRLDMDVEVESLARADGIDRRNRALRIVQDRAIPGRPALQVQYTIPTGPHGLENDALAVLRNAVDNGTRVDVVNIMVFDYYDGATTDMGAAAIQAATALQHQLGALYPDRSQAALWAMVGLTLMPGIDDYPQGTEVTTVEHARQVLAFARARGIGHLSIWAMQRDNGSCPGSAGSDHCSGIGQDEWAFSKVLGAFTER